MVRSSPPVASDARSPLLVADSSAPSEAMLDTMCAPDPLSAVTVSVFGIAGAGYQQQPEEIAVQFAYCGGGQRGVDGVQVVAGAQPAGEGVV